MFIDEFMTKAVITVRMDTDIVEARKLMIRHRIRHLPVIRSDRTLIGILTDRDVRSAMPSSAGRDPEAVEGGLEAGAGISVREIMTKDPATLSLSATIQDALLLIERKRVGAFPVVDEHSKLMGIVSDRDLLNAFIDVLGLKEPGALLGVVIDDRIEEMGKLVQAIVTEKITFGSILVYRDWRPGKRAVFPYLLAMNVTRLKQKLVQMGYDVLDPVEWDPRRKAS